VDCSSVGLARGKVLDAHTLSQINKPWTRNIDVVPCAIGGS